MNISDGDSRFDLEYYKTLEFSLQNDRFMQQLAVLFYCTPKHLRDAFKHQTRRKPGKKLANHHCIAAKYVILVLLSAECESWMHLMNKTFKLPPILGKVIQSFWLGGFVGYVLCFLPMDSVSGALVQQGWFLPNTVHSYQPSTDICWDTLIILL